MDFIAGLRKVLLILLVFTLLYPAVAQQSIRKYVQQHTVPLAQIDPRAEDDAELEVIGAAIGNARVVMLGEQDHGDAPSFLAKTRLIKYLHEKKGFNVLAFESDFFALTEGWERLDKKKSDIDSFLRNNIFSIWTFCDACRYLFYEYIPGSFQTASPLTVTGFDNQLILGYSRKHLTTRLDSVWRALGLPITKDPLYGQEILPLIDTLRTKYFARDKNTGVYHKLDSWLGIIRLQAAAKLPPDDYWLLLIDNLVQLNKELSEGNNWVRGNESRDLQMARNLRWLLDYRFPAEKIIVWAANGHIMKYTDSMTGKTRFLNMGTLFTRSESVRAQTYVLGFTSSTGRAGRLNFPTYSVAPPKSKSLDGWINKKYQYAFIDFTPYNALHPAGGEKFMMKGASHFYQEERWNKAYDGIFYIREMFACKAE